MITSAVKNTLTKPLVIGLAMLSVGLLTGVAAGKYANRIAVLACNSRTKPLPVAQATTPPVVPDASLPASDAWDPFREIRAMQREMDQMFQHAFSRFDFNASPQMDLLDPGNAQMRPLDVRDYNDHYEVRAFLPDTKDCQSKVKLNDNRLEVTVSHQQNSAQNSIAGINDCEWCNYTQVTELAGKLDSSRMKVETKGQELLITIPKSG